MTLEPSIVLCNSSIAECGGYQAFFLEVEEKTPILPPDKPNPEPKPEIPEPPSNPSPPETIPTPKEPEHVTPKFTFKAAKRIRGMKFQPAVIKKM